MTHLISFLFQIFDNNIVLTKVNQYSFKIGKYVVYVFMNESQLKTIKNDMIKLKNKYPNSELNIYCLDKQYSSQIIKKVNVNFNLRFGKIKRL